MSNYWHLYNESPEIITNDAAELFIKDIKDQLDGGYGFVPFIGAGFSAPSGAPLLWDLKSYLGRCIGLALGVEEKDMRPWNPRTDQWPPFTDRGRTAHDDWLTKVRLEFERRRDDRDDPEVSVFQEAIGAMAEWRTSLLFLSRLVRDRRGNDRDERQVIALDSPNQEVIDSCLREVMKGRQPTLGHRMLATLGGLLRLDVILTTNFDDLLERAFEQAKNSLVVSELHLNSQLPPWSAIANNRSIIKLHGNRHSLRADFSLDSLPPEADRWRFIEYLVSSDERHIASEWSLRGVRNPLPCENHLLLMGFSASERRTRALIEHAWSHLEPNFRVIWLCHSQNDVERIKTFTDEFVSRIKGVSEFESILTGPDGNPRKLSHILRHNQLGLLFLQIFQTLRRGLPSRGIIFPSCARLAVPPLRQRRSRLQSTTNHEQLIDAAMRNGFLVDKASASVDALCNDHVANLSPAIIEKAKYAILHDIALDLLQSRTDADLSVSNVESEFISWVAGSDKWSNGAYVQSAFCRSLGKIATTAHETNASQSMRDHFDHLRSQIESRLKRLREPGSKLVKLVVALSGDNIHGVTSVCADIYERRESQNDICLWLDMDDTSSAADFFEQLLDAAYYRLGFEHWMPTFLVKDPRMWAAEIRRLAQTVNRPWTIFINARETPGANFILDLTQEGPSPHGWLDLDTPVKGGGSLADDTACNQLFIKLLTALCGPDSETISVVLLCRGSNDKVRNTSSFFRAIEASGLIDRAEELHSSCVAFSVANAVKEVLAWVMECAKEAERRCRFVHTLVLMQRTRFLATIWSNEASFPKSSFPVENAETPGKELEWINALEDRGLLRRKIGGFIWLHSPIRTRLRRLLSTPTDRESAPDAFKKWSPEKQEASIHSRLAEWYMRVLAASGAPQAAFEAVYHLCQAAISHLKHHTETYPVDITDSIDGASSLIRAFSFMIQTQGYSRGTCRRLDFIRNDLCKEIRHCATQYPGKDDKDEVVESVDLLNLRATELMRSVAREVGEDGRAFKRQREVANVLLSNADPTTSASDMLFEQCFRKERSGALSRIDPCVEWVRWHRWNAMLGIGSRSYGAAKEALLIAITSVTRHGELNDNDSNPFLGHSTKYSEDNIVGETDQLEKAFLKTAKVLGHSPRHHQQLLVELARVVEQMLTLRLQESNLDRRLNNTSSTPKEAAGTRHIAKVGLRLVDRIMARDSSSDSHDMTAALWCRSRMLMHSAICVCSTEKPQWALAMKLLNDSEASLNVYESRRHEADRAVIDLYRAEVRLLEAGKTVIRGPSTDMPTVTTFEELSTNEAFWPDEEKSLLWREAGAKLRGQYLDGIIPDGVRCAKALVDDAIRFLDRAESTLLLQRRSVWWTTWFFQRKLRAIAMAIWATVADDHTPIPFLGLESSPRKTATIADLLLEDCMRLVRVDSYRLATVVDAYMSCYASLHCRLMFDTSLPRLPERQRAMHLHLQTATKRLKEVRDARVNWATPNDRGELPSIVVDVAPDSDRFKRMSGHAQTDPRVASYVKSVIERAERITDRPACALLDGNV